MLWSSTERVFFDYRNLQSSDGKIFSEAMLHVRSLQSLRELEQFSPLRDPLDPHGIDLEHYFSKKEEWVFFGGTFYPWHEGHGHILTSLKERGHGRVVVILDSNPEKKFSEIEEAECIKQFIYLQNYFPEICFLPGKWLAAEKNPTVHWMKRLKRRYPYQKMTLVVGDDQFHRMENWVEGETLISLLSHLYVFRRQFLPLETEKEIKRWQKKIPSLKVTFLTENPYDRMASRDLRGQSFGG
jgi:nicotinic acid mononucleotide adenylyltransferase